MNEEGPLERVNRLSAPLGHYKSTKREKQIGRTAAYYERLNEGKLPMREYRAGANKGQVPMIIRDGSLTEVEEEGTIIA